MTGMTRAIIRSSAVSGPVSVPHTAGTPERYPLTPRETEVLRLMSEGLTTKVIASTLKVSFKTAACHRSRILQKLGVETTVSAVRWAIRRGVIAP